MKSCAGERGQPAQGFEKQAWQTSEYKGVGSPKSALSITSILSAWNI